MITMAVKQFRKYRSPQEYLSLDEQMVKFKVSKSEFLSFKSDIFSSDLQHYIGNRCLRFYQILIDVFFNSNIFNIKISNM